MDLGLRDAVVVVVGGASGIGQAIAVEFEAEKARVALVDIVGGGPSSFLADVADYVAVARAAKEIRARFGRVDHMVFAAAVGSGKFGFPFWNLDPTDWDRVLRVNLIGAVNVAHAFAPVLADQKHGTMLFIASVAGQIGSQTDPPYSPRKPGSSTRPMCCEGPRLRVRELPLPAW